MERLNSQIDFLTKENQNLEDDLKTAKRELSRTDTLRGENHKLTTQLHELTSKMEHHKTHRQDQDHKVDKIRQDYESEVRELHHDIQELKSELANKDGSVQNLKRNIESLLEENEKLRDEAKSADKLIAA